MQSAAASPTRQAQATATRRCFLQQRGKASKALLALMATGGFINAEWHALVGIKDAKQKRAWLSRLLAARQVSRITRGVYRLHADPVPVPSCLPSMSEVDSRVWLALDNNDGLLSAEPGYLSTKTGIERKRVKASLLRFLKRGDLQMILWVAALAACGGPCAALG